MFRYDRITRELGNGLVVRHSELFGSLFFFPSLATHFFYRPWYTVMFGCFDTFYIFGWLMPVHCRSFFLHLPCVNTEHILEPLNIAFTYENGKKAKRVANSNVHIFRVILNCILLSAKQYIFSFLWARALARPMPFATHKPFKYTEKLLCSSEMSFSLRLPKNLSSTVVYTPATTIYIHQIPRRNETSERTKKRLFFFCKLQLSLRYVREYGSASTFNP